MSSKSPGQKRKQIIIQIVMLDDQEVPFQIDTKLIGKDLISLVYQYLKLIESDYFGLEYIDSKGKKCWLDYDKPVSKQVQNNAKLMFCVKFYTPDPGQLEEEYTRYLYALQIKRDLSEGLLLCSDATASLLVSYILQAEFGDHADNVNNQTNYFKEKNFFPHQTEDHEVKIIEYYKNHTGQTPADADLNLLDIARKVELYGIIMHPAKDHEGVQLNLAVAHMGILVFQNYTKINTFSWAKIRKLSFRRKKFLVKLHPENYGFYKDTVEFYFENRDESKNFWKKCIENHSFFRCISTQRMPRQKSKLLTRGSSFRYYGRTQKELIENTRENFSKNRSFDRSYHSMRCISQLGGVGGTGGSSGQINGTQSLNRNLASRSTGALMVPTSQQANLSSTLSSNDSNQNFHNYNQNTSSSAHHIAFMPTLNGDYHASNKTASLKHQASMEKSIIDQQQDPLSVQSLNNFQQNTQKQFRHDNDTSTHGSRTIDSRFSRDKTLNLSDEDNNNGHNDDDDDENENDGEDDNVDDNEDEAEEATAEKFLVPEPSKEENKKKKKPDEKCLCKHDIDTSHIPIQKQQALTNSGQKSRPSDNNDYSVNLFKGVNFKSSPIITGNSQPIYQTINQQQQQQQKLISLPIQQQKTYSKSKILNDDHRHHHHETEQPSATTTTSLVPVVSGSTNPNKIYSRKEVITTYKEETKNTHLEEYHQTTTFFDTPSGSVEYLSTVPQPLSHPHIITNTSLSKSANKNHMQHSPGHQHQVYQEMSKPGMESIYTNGLLSRSTPPTASGTAYSAPPKQLIKSTKVKTTTVTTTTPLKIARSKRQDDKDPNENNEDNDENDNQSDSNSKDDDTDNDNEATKNDRCSLAARILYSNFQQRPTDPSVNQFERVVRPSTLGKSFLIGKNDLLNSPLEKSKQTAKSRLYDSANNNLLKASINKYKQNVVENDDQQFPPPPPVPHQDQPHQHNFSSNQQTASTTIIQDYQEPIKSSLKPSQSNVLNDTKASLTSSFTFNIEDEFKRKKIPIAESYCIFKELVMTERTFKKDLDLLTQSFRQFATKNKFDLSDIVLFEQILFSKTLDPINEFHTEFLKVLEQRLFYWTDKNNSNNAEFQKIGDLLLNLSKILKNYRTFILKFEDIIVEIENISRKNKRFDMMFKDFEAQKICYLPFSLFLIKPIQRLIHYKILVERLLIFYGVKHHDYQDTYSAFSNIDEVCNLIAERLTAIENKQKLIELQRDLIGIEHLNSRLTRVFIREGSLQKLSRKGYQQRMFFLFNDILLYCARSSTPVLQFKVHGEYQLKNMQIEDGNSHINIPNSFTIYSSNRSLLVSAISQEEKQKWLQDLCEAIEKVKCQNDDKLNYSSLKSNSSSDNNLDSSGLNHEDLNENETTDQNISSVSADLQSKQSSQQHRANTTMHVCWHRNTSVSIKDNHRSLINQMSGYLLRKFKNSNGWQKLWVVFTNFCLFFYKTYQDEYPLASLPLLGYTITIPIESDNINKDYVFKLQFKNHVYFFRAESQYSFDRWIEVIESSANKQCQ